MPFRLEELEMGPSRSLNKMGLAKKQTLKNELGHSRYTPLGGCLGGHTYAKQKRTWRHHVNTCENWVSKGGVNNTKKLTCNEWVGRGGGWSVTLVTSTIRCDILSVNSFFSMYYNVVKLFCIQVRFRTCTVSYSPTLGRYPQDLYLSPTPSRMFWSCRPKISLPLLTLRVYHLGIQGQ
jgi:hypothetical protein